MIVKIGKGGVVGGGGVGGWGWVEQVTVFLPPGPKSSFFLLVSRKFSSAAPISHEPKVSVELTPSETGKSGIDNPYGIQCSLTESSLLS
jgi:hypothetical protein